MPSRPRKTDTTRPEAERLSFLSLLATNPNYFGNLSDSPFKPVTTIVSNTDYEQLTCVGFQTEANILEATVQIKRSFGYLGNLCTDGSTEYVRFFIDYNDAVGWRDAGLGGFRVHDIPNSTDCAGQADKPLTYVATVEIDPPRDFCGRPILPKVRAILSWQTMPPPDPNWRPVWGNVVLENHIQIKPRDWTLADVVDMTVVTPAASQATLPAVLEAAKSVPLTLPEAKPLTLVDLAKLYKTGQKGQPKTSVEPHRFGLKDLQIALDGSLGQKGIATKMTEWQSAGLDWSGSLGTLLKTSSNRDFEELECLGLEYNNEWLIASVRVKRPSGYSGSLCDHGSAEYVAFWADWDNTCRWTYLNTVEIKVHDIAGIPADGLRYAAILSVDLNAIRRTCDRPKIGRIRAVLSWGSRPSETDPDATPFWGNSLDAHVQVRPGRVLLPGEFDPGLRTIGGIPTENIDTGSGGTGMTLRGARFWYNDTPADSWGLERSCPFGGQVRIEGRYHGVRTGRSFVGYKYRVRARRLTTPFDEVILGDSFRILRWTTGWTDQVADSRGFFTYRDPEQHFSHTLAVWNTNRDQEGLWALRLEVFVSDADLSTPIGATDWLTILLDNTPPDCDIQIAAGGDCSDFVVGDTIHGQFVARDEHFGGFSLSTIPNNERIRSNQPTPVSGVTGSAGTIGTAPRVLLTGDSWTGGDAWQLATGNPPGSSGLIDMRPCGYVVHLGVSDLTIRDSLPGIHNSSAMDTAFCLRARS